MVEIAHFNDYLDSQLFQAFYPNSAQVTLQQTGDNKRLEQQATFLRDYINKSRINKSKINNSSIEQSKMNQDESKADTATDPSYSEQELDALLAAMLALNDAALLELFYPADKLYVDATLGKGRLSVINDNQTFGNPYPNNEITNYNDDGSPKLEAISVFSAFTAPHRNSLLSADNASWLLSLTQDSSEVWILPNTDVDSLPVMLWNQARFAVLGLGLLAILWLWSLYNRFGKMAQLSSQQSRDIMRYFRQVGRFGWHQDYAEQLTKATRDKVRLLINEALSNDPVANFDNKAGIYKRHNSSSPVIINEQHLIKLHDLLTSRLHHKKTALTGLDDLNDSDHLLLTNESFIREAISLARLQNALDEQAQNHNHAYGFTQMTQTLWMIKWLLK